MAEFIDNHRHRKLMKLVRGKKKSFHDQYDKKKELLHALWQYQQNQETSGNKVGSCVVIGTMFNKLDYAV